MRDWVVRLPLIVHVLSDTQVAIIITARHPVNFVCLVQDIITGHRESGYKSITFHAPL